MLEFSVTPGGDRMVFAWASHDVPAGDTNGWEDVYLREVPAGVTRLVSARAEGAGPGNGPSGAPAISADGRFVVFESLATDLVPGNDTNHATDVFLRNLETGVTLLISATATGIPGDRPSRQPLVSGDGSRVVFQSDALNLAPLTNCGTSLLVWTRGEGALQRVTLPGDPPFSGPFSVADPVLSADGRYLAFAFPPLSHVGDYRQVSVWWMDLETGDLRRVSGDLAAAGGAVVEGPSMSADGRMLAFTVVADIATELPQVRIWTPESGLKSLEELRLGVPPTTGEPGATFRPVLAADGGSLLFYSDEAVPEAGVPEGGEIRLYHRVLATGRTRLIAGEDVVFVGGISSDGQAVLWDTADPVFEPGDDNEVLDVVVTRLGDEAREVLSVVAPSASLRTAQGASTSTGGLSDDGRFLGFLSTADDLVAGDANRVTDGYVFDASGPGNRRVTGPPHGSGIVAQTRELLLSRSGRFVAFVTASRGWAAGDTNDLADVYVRDLVLGTTELASARDGTDLSLDQTATDVQLSADGRWISFWTTPPPDQSQYGVLHLRDRSTRRTTLVNSLGRTGGYFNPPGYYELSADGQVLLFSRDSRSSWIHREGSPELLTVETWYSLSPDGRRVAFSRTGSPAGGIWVRNLEGGGERPLLEFPINTDLIRDVAFSADGSVLTYCRRSNLREAPAGNPWQVWAMAVATGKPTLISASPEGTQGSGDSRVPQISADGRFIVYRTEAPKLVPGGGEVTQDIVVHDRYLGINRRLSATADGGAANNRSSRPRISGDGRMAAFTSAANDLVPGDGNGLQDVFLVAIPRDPAPDVDRDGLPDGWEVDRFGTLSRDGTGDADGDGLSDAEEWASGTDPNDAASGWRVRWESTGGTQQFRWRGSAGVLYRVERADSLAGPWTAIGPPLVGHEGIMSSALRDGITDEFLRVVASRSAL